MNTYLRGFTKPRYRARCQFTSKMYTYPISFYNIKNHMNWRNTLFLLAVGLFFIHPVLAETDSGDFGEDSSSDVAADNSSTATVQDLGPFGGDLWDVAIDSTNAMVYTVAKDSPNGFYRSDDGGTTWQGLSGVDYGGGVAVEVDSSSSVVFVMFANGLYRSEDQGETFTKISEHSGNGLLFADDLLLVGLGDTSSGGVVAISSDGGSNLSDVQYSLNADEYIWDIDYSADTDEFFIYAQEQSSNTNHLYRSADGGATWSAITLPAELATVTEGRFAVNPVNGQQLIVTGGNNVALFYSTNGGTAWTQAAVSSSGVTFDQTGRAWIAEQYSDDGGLTWTSYDDDNTASAIGGHNITVDPIDENIIFADGMPGLAVSTDRGLTWADSNSGILGVTISDISQANDKDIVWAAAYNGIAKTSNFTDATPTWQFPVLEEPGFAIWTDPANPNVAVAGVINGTRRTTDGGSTWSEYAGTDVLASFQVFDEIINDVNDTAILYAAISNNDPTAAKTGAVLRSTDQGVTWEDMSLPNSGSAQSITQTPGGDLYVGLGAESDIDGETGIYKYSSGNWGKLTTAPDQDIVKIIADPDEENTVYALAGLLYNNGVEDTFGFYKTTDGGANWSHITDGLDSLRNYTSLALQSSSTPNTLYIGAENFSGQGVLYKSADAGETWGVQYTGLQDETFYTLLFDGVTVGSSRGLFDVKSKAAIVVKLAKKKVNLGKPHEVTVTVKDAITNKALRNQKVKIYTKKGSNLTKVKTVETNSKGKVSFKLKFKKAKQYKLVAKWVPPSNKTEEYATTTSDSVKLTVKQ